MKKKKKKFIYDPKTIPEYEDRVNIKRIKFRR